MRQKVFCGADVVAKGGITFDGKCGLITNHTGVLKDLSSTIDMLKEKCDLVALFAPEHGVRGDKQASEDVFTYTDERSGIVVYSLYGKTFEDGKKALAELDTVIFDIQDVGSRYYTYAYTMTDAMKICAEHGVKFVVLDRPNPIGGLVVEGTILKREFSSGVGRFPVPVRTGLTIGEFAMMMNDAENIGCDLSVIKMENWKRDLFFDETDLCFINPSPNIPTVDSAFYYIGTCLFEGTNMSEGRGTTKPFEVFGAPWLEPQKVIEMLGKQPGVVLRETHFTPTFSKHKDTFCNGIQVHITNRDEFKPFEVGVRLIDAIRKTHKEFEITNFFNMLLGTDDFSSEDFCVEKLIKKQRKDASEWQEKSKKWYLY